MVRRAVLGPVRGPRHTPRATPAMSLEELNGFWRSRSGGALGVSGFGVGRFAMDEEPPKGVQVAAQDAQHQVTFQTQLAPESSRRSPANLAEPGSTHLGN